MGKSVLSLDTLEPDRDFIDIDGKPFYLRSDDELSLAEVAKIRRLAKKVNDGMAETATDEQLMQVEGYADSVLDILVVDLPAEMKGKLKSNQKFQIVTAFTTAASSRRAGAMAVSKTSEG
jgi:hypothetical protein